MKPQNEQQLDWLAQTEELNDIEASQVNGGMTPASVAGDASASASSQDFSANVSQLKAMFALATQRNIELREVTAQEGTILNAAKKDVNPK